VDKDDEADPLGDNLQRPIERPTNSLRRRAILDADRIADMVVNEPAQRVGGGKQATRGGMDMDG
jgi:hypothetical protein